jgi:type III restriction enzyme
MSESATQLHWITKTPGVCGGEACVRGTRISVRGLVEWRREGLTDDEILRNIQGLTPESLQAVWDYYAAHREEVEETIRRNAEA